jgi:hypothetical protein
MPMREPPPGIERMTPADIWREAYRAGREDLAAGVQADALAREHAEARTPERLTAIETALRALQDNDVDQAGQLADVVRRMGEMEGTR